MGIHISEHAPVTYSTAHKHAASIQSAVKSGPNQTHELGFYLEKHGDKIRVGIHSPHNKKLYSQASLDKIIEFTSGIKQKHGNGVNASHWSRDSGLIGAGGGSHSGRHMPSNSVRVKHHQTAFNKTRQAERVSHGVYHDREKGYLLGSLGHIAGQGHIGDRSSATTILRSSNGRPIGDDVGLNIRNLSDAHVTSRHWGRSNIQNYPITPGYLVNAARAQRNIVA